MSLWHVGRLKKPTPPRVAERVGGLDASAELRTVRARAGSKDGTPHGPLELHAQRGTMCRGRSTAPIAIHSAPSGWCVTLPPASASCTRRALLTSSAWASCLLPLVCILPLPLLLAFLQNGHWKVEKECRAPCGRCPERRPSLTHRCVNSKLGALLPQRNFRTLHVGHSLRLLRHGQVLDIIDDVGCVNVHS